MSIAYKKIAMANPMRRDEPVLYYPRLVSPGKAVTLATLSAEMKERSSLSKGDILSVLTNFVEVARQKLQEGGRVNVDGLGCFHLTANTVGTKTMEECTAKNITALHVRFRPSGAFKIDLNASRPEDRPSFHEVTEETKESGKPCGNCGSGGGDNKPPTPGAKPGNDEDEDGGFGG